MKPKVKAVRIRETRLDKTTSKHQIKKANSKASANKKLWLCYGEFLYLHFAHFTNN